MKEPYPNRPQAVIVVLVKPEHDQYPQVYGVYSDVALANREIHGYMGDFDPENPWEDVLGSEPVTEERVLSWDPAPGDTEEFEFERDGVIISGHLEEVQYPVED